MRNTQERYGVLGGGDGDEADIGDGGGAGGGGGISNISGSSGDNGTRRHSRGKKKNSGRRGFPGRPSGRLRRGNNGSWEGSGDEEGEENQHEADEEAGGGVLMVGMGSIGADRSSRNNGEPAVLVAGVCIGGGGGVGAAAGAGGLTGGPGSSTGASAGLGLGREWSWLGMRLGRSGSAGIRTGQHAGTAAGHHPKTRVKSRAQRLMEVRRHLLQKHGLWSGA